MESIACVVSIPRKAGKAKRLIIRMLFNPWSVIIGNIFYFYYDDILLLFSQLLIPYSPANFSNKFCRSVL
jgi:hypothetical protein